MTINKYWIKPKKRYNKTYKNVLTLRRKKINTDRAFALLVMWFIFTATYAVANVSNNLYINGVVVEQSAGAFVIPQVEGDQDLLSPPSIKVIKTVSAYSEYDSCHYPTKGGCLTASGKIVKDGMVATNLYPFGTKIIIGGREFTVEDRISKRYNNRLDIWMGYGEEGSQKAKNWGLKTLSIKIIK